MQKSVNLFSSFLGGACLILSGCSDKLNEEQLKSTQEAFVIGYDYLTLSGDKYLLSLTPEKAVSLGIATKDYERMLSDIRQTNVSIKNLLAQDPQTKIDLPDPQKKDIKDKIKQGVMGQAISKARMPGGSTTIYSTGQDECRSTLLLPWNAYSDMRVSCYASGFLQTFNVRAVVGNSTVSDGGVSFFGNWSCTLMLPYVNADCSVYFKTANSYGGNGTFSFDIEK